MLFENAQLRQQVSRLLALAPSRGLGMIGPMAIRELAGDLKDVAIRLAAVAAEGDDPVISGPVKAGLDATLKVERAWSGLPLHP